MWPNFRYRARVNDWREAVVAEDRVDDDVPDEFGLEFGSVRDGLFEKLFGGGGVVM